MNVYAVIMAGGAGTRFWPASRTSRPKQLLALAADPNESLLAATVRRLDPLIAPQNVFIATGAHLADASAKLLPGVPKSQILAEPVPRNTAPCIGWATATIARKDPEAIVCVLPSDHFMANEAGFRTTVGVAIEAAKKGYLTTIGIVPTRPETGYGYIEVGKKMDGDAFEVARFVEKPNRERAEAFMKGGKHLWNGGMFFFRAKDMIVEIDTYLPDLADGLRKIDEAAKKGEEPKALTEIFPRLPSISIDNGVMEKAKKLAVVQGDFGWSDVGSWESAWELAKKDANGNAAPPGSIAHDAKNNLVVDLTTNAKAGKNKAIALVGVSDLVVVETDDALLVIPRERAQDVRAAVDALKAAGKTELL
ncbi:MAG: mannose-1-phosphate guanylyltransferase [Polyangiaceae bacterium]